jgi:hypothetical protein
VEDVIELSDELYVFVDELRVFVINNACLWVDLCASWWRTRSGKLTSWKSFYHIYISLSLFLGDWLHIYYHGLWVPSFYEE